MVAFRPGRSCRKRTGLPRKKATSIEVSSIIGAVKTTAGTAIHKSKSRFNSYPVLASGVVIASHLKALRDSLSVYFDSLSGVCFPCQLRSRRLLCPIHHDLYVGVILQS